MGRALQGVVVSGATVALGFALYALASADLTSQLERAYVVPAPSHNADAATAALRSAARVLPGAGAPRAARGAEAALAPLKIEVARIEADGVSVLAGRAPAGSEVDILANGRRVGRVVASADGQWSAIVSEGIAPGPLALQLEARRPGDAAPLLSAVAHLTVPEGATTSLASAVITQPLVTGALPVAKVAGRDAEDQRDLRRFAALVDKARSDKGSPSVGRMASAAVVEAPVPVPITFASNAAELTEDGRAAAALLAEYLRLEQPKAITLTGHADARGTDAYNMDLSRRRLEAIERYLREAGYDGRLALLPRGRSVPFAGIDRERLPRAIVWQADRRVELRLER